MKQTNFLLKTLLGASLALAAVAIAAFLIAPPLPAPHFPAVSSAQPAPSAPAATGAETQIAPAKNESLPGAVSVNAVARWTHPAPQRPAPPDPATPETKTISPSATASAAGNSRDGKPVQTASAPAHSPTASPGEVFERDYGVEVPAAFVSIDPQINLSKPQAEQLSKIASEFLQGVEASPDTSAAWQAERVRANERVKTLFGRDLYMRQMLNAAREARGQSMLPPP